MTASALQVLPAFARHETFHPRVGWLTKAVEEASVDPFVFADERAPVQLGVGKNMVRAIKFWGLATKVIEERPDRRRGRTVPVHPTPLGEALLGEGGWDPYLEDPHSLWLLHWMLLRPPSRVPVWWWTFRELEAAEFDARALEDLAFRRAAAIGWSPPARSSVTKDIDCLVRMYGRRGRSGGFDSLDSPFLSLGILEALPGSTSKWTIGRAPVEPVDPHVVGFACLDTMLRWDDKTRSVSTARLATAVDGPGRVLCLTEVELIDALSALEPEYPELRLVSPAGFHQLVLEKAAPEFMGRLIDDMYPLSDADSALLATVRPEEEPRRAA